jgi:hypothetical protein
MARPPGPREARPEDMLDRAIQPARVYARSEHFITWMARFCGP